VRRCVALAQPTTPRTPRIDYDGQMEEAGPRGNVRDVRYPQAIGTGGGEVPGDNIAGGRPRGVPGRRDHVPTATHAAHTGEAHEPGDSRAPDAYRLGAELGMRAGAPYEPREQWWIA
jgi:hypothetical protein